MTIKDLIPGRRKGMEVPSPGQQEDVYLDLRSRMNRLFDDFFERPFDLSPWTGESSLIGDFAPRMEIGETDDEILVTAELPGMDPKDIEVNLENNTLMIRGEKRAEKEEKKKRTIYVERSYGAFNRSIPLPADVDADKVEASFKRGVLKVTIPKLGKAHRKGKLIEIKAGN